MSNLLFDAVSVSENELTVTLKDKGKAGWTRNIIIGIDQFERVLYETAAARLSRGERAAGPPRLPKPAPEANRYKECSGCGVKFYDSSRWGNMKYHDPKCRNKTLYPSTREKTCMTCKKPFTDESKHNNRKYCRDECRMSMDAVRADRLKHLERRKKHREIVAPKAVPVVKQKKVAPKPMSRCPWCGALKKREAEYCSTRCRDLARAYRRFTGEK